MTFKRPHLFFNLRLPIDKDKMVSPPPLPLSTTKDWQSFWLAMFRFLQPTSSTTTKAKTTNQAPQNNQKKAWNLDLISTLFSNQLLHMLIIKSITKLVPSHTLRGGFHVFFWVNLQVGHENTLWVDKVKLQDSQFDIFLKVLTQSCNIHNLMFLGILFESFKY